jgi:nitrogen fixation protein NifU and related proteins
MPETALYDDLIMDHIRNARNYRAPQDVQRKTTGFNPLCGDEMTLYLRIRNGLLEDIAFQCTCCGISMASASIMTELLKYRDPAEARDEVQAFMALLDNRAAPVLPRPTREQDALVDLARKFPSRVRCASLPWFTLARALAEVADASGVR